MYSTCLYPSELFWLNGCYLEILSRKVSPVKPENPWNKSSLNLPHTALAIFLTIAHWKRPILWFTCRYFAAWNFTYNVHVSQSHAKCEMFSFMHAKLQSGCKTNATQSPVPCARRPCLSAKLWLTHTSSPSMSKKVSHSLPSLSISLLLYSTVSFVTRAESRTCTDRQAG